MTLDVSTPQGCFGTNFHRCTIGNAYAKPLPPFPHSVFPRYSFLDLDHLYRVSGDFNISERSNLPLQAPLLARREGVRPPI